MGAREAGAAAGGRALEVIPPRLNEKTPAAVETLLQALALDRGRPFALELAGEPGRVRFLARTADAEVQTHLASQLRLAYPQAELRAVAPEDDPARPADGLAAAAAELRLRAGNHLPLKDYRDGDWRDGGADPLLALLAALGDGDRAGDAGRAICQVVLTPARPDWSRGLERLALDNPVLREERLEQARRMAQVRAGGGGPGAGTVAALLGLLSGGLQAKAWWGSGDYLPLALAGGGLLLATPAVLWLLARLNRPKPVYDPKLVAQKIERVGYHAHVRLVAIAPTRAAADAWLVRLQAAYSQYSLATGNGFVPVPWEGDPAVLGGQRRFRRPLPILTGREVATLWHLPQGADEVPFLDRTAHRRLLPTPQALAATAADACPIGRSRHQGLEAVVALPAVALARNTLLVAKTGKGKSTLMEHLAVWQAEQRSGAVVVFDPHGDLARGILAALPEGGVDEPAYLDFADEAHPVGLNLLDMHAGRGRDKAVANVVDVFSRVWNQAWGPRMEDALRFALLTLCEVNEKLPPDRQYGVLHVKRLFTDEPFRRALLPFVDDFEVKEWWRRDFALMPKHFAQEVLKPVITKLNRFAATEVARNILSQPRTTLDLKALVRERRVLLVNTAAGVLGPGTAGLLGATLLDLLGLVIMEQASLPAERRMPVLVLVDEFHALPAVEWAELLGQLRKFGGRFVLATQALARLDATDPALRGTVFGNVDTLGVFQVSAEDARYLKHELDGVVDETDLTNLPDHQLYLKTTAGDGRLPTCLVETLPPCGGSADAAAALARASARRYGRPAAEVEALRKAVGRQHHAWARDTRRESEPAAEAPGSPTQHGEAGDTRSADPELRDIQGELDL